MCSLKMAVIVIAVKFGNTTIRMRPEWASRRSTATRMGTRQTVLQLSAPFDPRLRPPNPGVIDSTSPCRGSRAALTIARRSLWSISHAVS